MTLRTLRLVCLALALWLCAPAALAQNTAAQAAPSAPPDSWAAQLDTLVRWAEQNRAGRECAQRCFALQRLTLTGSLDPGPVRFELEGAVLADRPVAVPLFGPAGKVRVDGVTENGLPAAVSFDDRGYFVQTAARRFVLRGTLSFQDDLALTIPGPLNALDADLTGARVVEGAHLAGLRDATVHLDRGAAQAPAAGPTVFQLSHAVRVGREVAFTYKLVMRSGADLGVVRLPLRFGERVLDVTGSTGWRVDGADLTLPTSGREADITITGTLPSLASFSPDPRSEYEWWLLESDAEHRVTVTGDARQMDSGESPIPRTQPSARLFLVQRGQRLEASVQRLAAVEALAAVVHSQHRITVVTRQGDVVSDDTLRYENNGIDYLLYHPHARPIFLSTDGVAERIMHRDRTPEVMIPLRTGSHEARAQSIGGTTLHALAGWLRLPTATHPLSTSRASMTIGLPPGVIPLAALGGDVPWYAFDLDDVAAVLGAFLVAWIALRDTRRRVLGGVALAGTWFVSQGLFGALVAAVVCGGALWLAHRLLEGAARTLAKLALGGAVCLAMLVAVGSMFTLGRSVSRSPTRDMDTVDAPAAQSSSSEEGGTGARHRSSEGRMGNVYAQDASNGVLQGVTPVAVTLPNYERSVTLRRELVTRDRTFEPAVLYATRLALAPVALAWLACVLALALSYRREAEALRDRLRERLAKPEGV